MKKPRELAGKGRATGVAKQQMLELKIAQSLVEAEDFDLIAMGRPEGAGCYCFANNVLKQALQTIAGNYPCVLIDNEAGLENLSRRIVTQVDLMLVVADPSKRGLETVRRLYDLAREMGVQYDKLVIIVNRMRQSQLPPGVAELKVYTNAHDVIGLPDDAILAAHNEAGKSLRQVPANNEVVRRIDAFLDQLDVKPGAISPIPAVRRELSSPPIALGTLGDSSGTDKTGKKPVRSGHGQRFDPDDREIAGRVCRHVFFACRHASGALRIWDERGVLPDLLHGSVPHHAKAPTGVAVPMPTR